MNVERLTIDFDPDVEFAGLLTSGGQPPSAFTGWLELISKLEKLTSGATDRAGGEDSEPD